MKILVFNLRRNFFGLLLLLSLFGLTVYFAMAESRSIQVFTVPKELPIYSVERPDQVVALTFDCAWEAEDIPDILRALKNEDIQASFFMVGRWAEKNPQAVQMIAAGGHDISNHSYSHLRMGGIDQKRIQFEISEANKKLQEISGKQVTLFRAPYGDYNNQVIQSSKGLGLYAIQWDVDSLDWKPGIKKEEIMKRISEKARPGSIILLHNATRHTAVLLPNIIQTLKSKGYGFLPVSKMIYTDNYVIDHQGRQKKVD